MNKRNIGILSLIIVCAVAVGFMIYYLIFLNSDKTSKQPTVVLTPKTPEATLVTNIPPTASTDTATTEPVPAGAPEDIVEQGAGQVAKIFVERFGTYSNQVGAEQFSDLKLFITAKMQVWVDAQVIKFLGDQADYKTAHVVRTQAVTVKVISLDKSAGTATVMVSARRTDQTGEDTAKLSYPEIKLQVVKAGKRWQVDSVVWQ